MALLIKNVPSLRSAGTSQGGFAVAFQTLQVTRSAAALPQTSTEMLFRVRGGRVLVHALIGQVTTILQAIINNLKVTSKALDASSVAVGTAVDLSANVDGNGKEVGSLYVVLQSGAAAVWSNAGAGLQTLGNGPIILPQGEVYITTSASATGAMKWDMWYQPLDAGAFVEAQNAGTAII